MAGETEQSADAADSGKPERLRGTLLNSSEGRVLLLHGELEDGAAACAANVRPEAGGLAIGLPGATASWDAPQSILSDALTLWPHPSGQGRVAARGSDRATAASAGLALDWLAPLKPPAR